MRLIQCYRWEGGRGTDSDHPCDLCNSNNRGIKKLRLSWDKLKFTTVEFCLFWTTWAFRRTNCMKNCKNNENNKTWSSVSNSSLVRGGVTKKNGKIWENIPKGRGVKNRRKFPISIWEFEKSREGVSIFQKCLNFNYFEIILQLFCNITFIRNG